MGIYAEFEKREREVFPHNKIILWDGRMLDCYPLAAQAPDKIYEDHLELDTTGQFLSVGAKKPQPVSPKSKDTEEQKELFIKNAFYLLAHKERIMSDSRMFLCRIPIQSGMAYTGISGFRNPTLGIYLEWWSIVEGAMRTDRKGRKSLVYHLAGSPLSGANKCAAVREDGKIEIVSLSPFNAHWGPFTRLNNRYTEAKQLYQAYTLQEVLDILHHEDDGDLDYSTGIKELFMQHEIDSLNERVKRLSEEASKWYKMYHETLMKYNDARVSKAYTELEALRARVETEIDLIREQKQELKAEMKSGRLDNITYQKKLMPLNKQIRALEMEVSACQYDLHNRFLEDGISYSMIEDYMRTKKKDGNK